MFVRTQFSLFRFENLRLFTICLNFGAPDADAQIVLNFWIFFVPSIVMLTLLTGPWRWRLLFGVSFSQFAFFSLVWLYLINSWFESLVMVGRRICEDLWFRNWILSNFIYKYHRFLNKNLTGLYIVIRHLLFISFLENFSLENTICHWYHCYQFAKIDFWLLQGNF